MLFHFVKFENIKCVFIALCLQTYTIYVERKGEFLYKIQRYYIKAFIKL